MSINLDDVLVKKFENEAIQAFQDAGAGLRNAVRVKDAKGANQIQFQVLGKMLSAERGAIHTDIPLQDVSHTPKVATVKNYVVSEMTDIFLNNQVGFDERQELVQAITMAMGRRLDQVVIDALVTATITKTVADDIGGAADNLNVAMLAEVSRLLGSDVPDTDRHYLCHDDGFYHLLQETTIASMDFNIRKSLATGELPEYLGLAIHKIGDRAEGGLALATLARTNFAWQKTAVGLAINMEPKITIDWEPSKGAHRVTGYMSAGAIVIQEDGVVEITTEE